MSPKPVRPRLPEKPSRHIAPLILSALVLAVGVALFHFQQNLKKKSSFSFELILQSAADGNAQVYFDTGSGFRRDLAATIPVRKGTGPLRYRFSVPTGDYHGVLLRPLDAPGVVTFYGANFLGPEGEILRTVFPAEFQAGPGLSVIQNLRESVQWATPPATTEAFAQARPASPVNLQANSEALIPALVREGAFLTLLFAAILYGLDVYLFRRFSRFDAARSRLWQRVTSHPRTAIAAVSIAATLISCFPIVFFEKSFVSPNTGGVTYLLYEGYPTVPGSHDPEAGGYPMDLGAMMWAHLPYSFVESRTLLRDAEVPLWNRYNSGGVPLLGQGQSMLGDPLHIPVLLSGGSTLAWDLKFILAKMLFASGIGLVLFAATSDIAAALALTASSAFIGFFFYRFNHAAFFTVSYSPWILLAWMKIAREQSSRKLVTAMGLLFLASFSVLNSGTVKESYMILLFFNLTGALILLFSGNSRPLLLRKTVSLSLLGSLFLLISSPVWLTLLDTLGKSFTLYEAVSAEQISPTLLAGLFDDIFYRTISSKMEPSANFFVLLGIAWCFPRLKTVATDRLFLALIPGVLIPLALAFGVIPGSVIGKIPFIRNIGHIDDVFSSILIVHLILLGGFGMKMMIASCRAQRFGLDFAKAMVLPAAILFVYFLFHRPARPAPLTFYLYFAMLAGSLLCIPVAARNLTTGEKDLGSVLLLLLGIVALHWRFGFYLDTEFKSYVMKPLTRVDLTEKSPALEWIRAKGSEPYRVVGFDGNFWPGYSGVVAMEGISGPDALMSPYYRQLLDASGVERIWGWVSLVRPSTLPDLRPLYDMLNIRYYLAPRNADGIGGLDLVNRLDLAVFESRTVWPRAFYVDRLSTYRDLPELVHRVKSGDGRPFAAVEETEPARLPVLKALLNKPGDRTVVAASDYRLTGNSTRFRLSAPGPGLVVLSETDYPGDFIATVNGRPAELIRVNHAFKGIQVESGGQYDVSVRYWPRPFGLTLWLSGGGAILALLAGFLFRKFGDREK